MGAQEELWRRTEEDEGQALAILLKRNGRAGCRSLSVTVPNRPAGTVAAPRRAPRDPIDKTGRREHADRLAEPQNPLLQRVVVADLQGHAEGSVGPILHLLRFVPGPFLDERRHLPVNSNRTLDVGPLWTPNDLLNGSEPNSAFRTNVSSLTGIVHHGTRMVSDRISLTFATIVGSACMGHAKITGQSLLRCSPHRGVDGPCRP